MLKKPRIRENPVIRRAQIVDEGIKIIGERGYNGFTVQSLAERCKISNAGLLHYFESKDKLLISLLDEIERREMEMVSTHIADAFSALDGGAAPEPIVYKVLHSLVVNFAKTPEIGRFLTVLFAEALDKNHPAHDWIKLAERETLDLFEGLLVYLDVNRESKARQLYAQMRGLQLQWFSSDQGFDLVGEWSESIRTLLLFDGDDNVWKRP
jgi:AcrR family transcriptional regulator